MLQSSYANWPSVVLGVASLLSAAGLGMWAGSAQACWWSFASAGTAGPAVAITERPTEPPPVAPPPVAPPPVAPPPPIAPPPVEPTPLMPPPPVVPPPPSEPVPTSVPASGPTPETLRRIDELTVSLEESRRREEEARLRDDEARRRLLELEAERDRLRRELTERPPAGAVPADRLELTLLERDALIDKLRRELEEARRKPVPPPVAPPPADVRREEFGGGTTTVRTDEQITITLAERVLFDSGKADLKPEATVTLDRIAAFIREKYSDKLVEVVGHTDVQPIRHSGWRDNWQLSVARALSVLRRLQESGVDTRHSKVSGRGEFQPVSTDWAQNRRVEITIWLKSPAAIGERGVPAPVVTTPVVTTPVVTTPGVPTAPRDETPLK